MDNGQLTIIGATDDTTPVGVVLRAANQNQLIAGGNHTFIHRLLCRPPRYNYYLCG